VKPFWVIRIIGEVFVRYGTGTGNDLLIVEEFCVSDKLASFFLNLSSFFAERRLGPGKLASSQQNSSSQLSVKQEQQHQYQHHQQQLAQQHTISSSSSRQSVQSASVSTQASRPFHATNSALAAGGELAARVVPDLRSSPRLGSSPNLEARNSPRPAAGVSPSGVPVSDGSPVVELRRSGRSSVEVGPAAAAAAPRRKSEGTNKDYNRHWLIQVKKKIGKLPQ
jgi:hypothetical protein